MGKLVIECVNKRIRTGKIAQAVYQALNQTDFLKAELVFVSSEDIHALNNRTRGVDNVTDVLSFPTLDNHRGKVLHREEHMFELDGKNLFLGSIVICEERVREQAKEIGHSEQEERTYLIIHGLMHLFGYDHMGSKDKKEMREMEKRALNILYKNQTEDNVNKKVKQKTEKKSQ